MFRPKVSVGIDIGYHSIKLAVVRSRKDRVLHLVEDVILPERASLEDQCSQARVITAIKNMCAPYVGPRSKYSSSVFASFQSEGAVYRYLELPPLKGEQQRTAVASAAAKMLTYPLEEASIISLPIPASDQDNRKTGTFLMAFRKDLVEKHGALLKESGLEIERLEAAPLPLLRALTANHGKFPGEFVGLVDVGSRLTSVVVARDGHPYFARDFALGGSCFTYAFQMGAQSTWQEAELYKRDYDVAAREITIEPALDRWLDQVKRSLDSPAKTNPELSPKIQRVFLTGGCAAWKGLAQRMEQTLEIPVTASTWQRLVPPDDLHGVSLGTFATALGLDLG